MDVLWLTFVCYCFEFLFYRYFIMCLNVYLHHSPPPAPLVLAVKTPRQFTYTSHALKILTVEKYRIKNLKIMHLINHHSHNIFINRIVMDSCHSQKQSHNIYFFLFFNAHGNRKWIKYNKNGRVRVNQFKICI